MRVVFACAGTGGHINPAIAMANLILKKENDSQILFIGTETGLENKLVENAGYKISHIRTGKILRELTLKNITALINAYKGIGDAKTILKEFKPDIIIGTGGYICGPVMKAAKKLKIPYYLHESNAFPGVSVKLLAKDAKCVMVGFEDAKARLNPKAKVVYTGTPAKFTEEDIFNLNKEQCINKLKLENINKKIVLVTCGSQGAKKINDSVYNIIKNNLNKKYQIVWATGPKQFDIIKTALKNDSIDIEKLNNVKILPYIYNMDEMMNISDLLICRSGAMTITEISIVGKPAIFIPLPSKMANRQEDNAKVLEKIGAAKIISNNVVDYQNLSEMIDFIIQDRIRLEEMGKIAKTLAPENTEEKIYNEIKSILH